MQSDEGTKTVSDEDGDALSSAASELVAVARDQLSPDVKDKRQLLTRVLVASQESSGMTQVEDDSDSLTG